jgi:hypothetical protein
MSNECRIKTFVKLTENNINYHINSMINEAKIQPNKIDQKHALLDIFKIWFYKRHVREGSKEKLLSYKYFLELYDIFPEACIEIVNERIFGEIGYWKDLFLIWGLINKMEIDDTERYIKYNRLIESFRKSILDQRLEDLRKLNKCVSPKKLGDFSNDDLREFLNNINKPKLSYVGKYCIREKSVFNKCLFWYVKTDTELIKQSNISYMMRGSLRIINDKNELCEYPNNKQVPSATKKTYRKLNAKLNVALDVPEMLMCNKQFELLDPLTFPYLFRKRNENALLKNNILKVYRKDSDYKYSFNESFDDAMNKPIYTSLEKANIINKIFKDIDILLI